MDLKLAEKLALVSGSTAGIGYAIAESLAAEGARVIVNGRSQAGVDTALATLRKATNKEVIGFAGDLSDAAVAEALVRKHPGIEILVNNLGIFEPKPFEEIPDADWRRFFDVNVLSGARLARLVLPAMRRANWGRIIFISSESGVQIPAEMVHYGMTKAAQIAIARGIAESVAGTGITVNSVLARTHEVSRCRRFRRCAREGTGQVRRGVREGILRARAPYFAAQAIQLTAGSGVAGRVRREPAVIGDHWHRATCRRRHGEERVLIMTEELKEIAKIPGPEEWARHNDDIDARNVHAFWFGKSLDEVQKYFGGGQSIQRGDELLFMPRRAFQFYIFAFAQYVTSETAIGDSDGASSFLGCLIARETEDPGKRRADLRSAAGHHRVRGREPGAVCRRTRPLRRLPRKSGRACQALRQGV